MPHTHTVATNLGVSIAATCTIDSRAECDDIKIKVNYPRDYWQWLRANRYDATPWYNVEIRGKCHTWLVECTTWNPDKGDGYDCPTCGTEVQVFNSNCTVTAV